jgi:anti-anti-sigma regulatory factor
VFDFKLTRESGTTLLILQDAVVGNDDVDVLTEAFAFARPNEHLVLDLSEVEELESRGAELIHDTLIRRAVMAETVVVSPKENVSMQLVLHDVDRVSPIVRTQQEAMQILDGPWSQRRAPRQPHRTT